MFPCLIIDFWKTRLGLINCCSATIHHNAGHIAGISKWLLKERMNALASMLSG